MSGDLDSKNLKDVHRARRLPPGGLLKPPALRGVADYIGVVGYRSLMSVQQDTIKIEVGLREPVLTAVHRGSAKTILFNPVSDSPLVKPASLRCISKIEAFAEKFRAAMTRRDVAIRDFYDIDYALRRLDIHLSDSELVRLVSQKLAVPGNDPVDVSEGRLEALRRQLETRLSGGYGKRHCTGSPVSGAERIFPILSGRGQQPTHRESHRVCSKGRRWIAGILANEGNLQYGGLQGVFV